MNIFSAYRYDVRWQFILKNEQHPHNSLLLLRPRTTHKKPLHHKATRAQIQSSENQHSPQVQHKQTPHLTNSNLSPKVTFTPNHLNQSKNSKLNQKSNLIKKNENEAYIQYLKSILSKSEKHCIKLLQK